MSDPVRNESDLRGVQFFRLWIFFIYDIQTRTKLKENRYIEYLASMYWS